MTRRRALRVAADRKPLSRPFNSQASAPEKRGAVGRDLRPMSLRWAVERASKNAGPLRLHILARTGNYSNDPRYRNHLPRRRRLRSGPATPESWAPAGRTREPPRVAPRSDNPTRGLSLAIRCAARHPQGIPLRKDPPGGQRRSRASTQGLRKWRRPRPAACHVHGAGSFVHDPSRASAAPCRSNGPESGHDHDVWRDFSAVDSDNVRP